MTDQHNEGSEGIFEALWANEQFKSGLRTAIQTLGTAVAAKGVIDASWVPGLVGFVMWLIPTVWGLYVRRRNGLIKTVDGLPGVLGVAVTPAVDAVIESRTVTTPEKLAGAIASAALTR